MKKAVAIVSQDSELEQMVKALTEVDEHYDQKQEFLVKQAKDLKKERKARSEPILNSILNHLRDHNKLPPGFDEKTHHLHVDEDADAVMVCDGSEHSGHPILQFLGGLGFNPESLE
jgi:hypothetical protein